MGKHKSHSHHTSHSEEEMSVGSKCGFGWLMILTQILIFGVTALSIYYFVEYRGGFAWEDSNPGLQFNFHPVLMIGGFIFFMAQSMLVYRNCRCCKKTYAKLLHTLMHLLAMPCLAVGTVAAFEFHRRIKVPHFYSIHSWIGLGTLGLFALQFIVGFFTYLVFLCCEKSTANFRARMMPNHVHFGIATLVMAVMACLTGINEHGIFHNMPQYKEFGEITYILNVLGVALVLIVILVSYIIRNERFRRIRIISMS